MVSAPLACPPLFQVLRGLCLPSSRPGEFAVATIGGEIVQLKTGAAGMSEHRTGLVRASREGHAGQRGNPRVRSVRSMLTVKGRSAAKGPEALAIRA